MREGQITIVDLASDYASGTVGASFSDSSFAEPTTIARFDGCLLVVNSQFDAPQGQPQLPFTIFSVPAPGLATGTPTAMARCKETMRNDTEEVIVKIGIIGAGNVGRALAIASVRAGHRVTITAPSADEAGHVAAEIGANAARSNAEAVTDAEIVILAVPFDAVQSIASELGSGLDGKILIDVTNRFRPEQLDGSSNAELIQGMVPTALVVKAFNTVFASHQVDPVIDGIQLDGYVAGNDATAKQRVLELVDSLGFRPIDTGSLAMARALEGMALLNISLNMVNGWPWQTGWKLLGPSG